MHVEPVGGAPKPKRLKNVTFLLMLIALCLYQNACTGLTSAGTAKIANSGPPDTTPPTVSITSPANGATVSGNVTVSAYASDNVAVAGVQFRVDGTSTGGQVTSAPYNISLNTLTLSNGTHTLTATATDTSNNSTTSAAVAIAVNNDSTPPTVSLSAPANGGELLLRWNEYYRLRRRKFLQLAIGNRIRYAWYL